MLKIKAKVLESKEFRKIDGILTIDKNYLIFKSTDLYYPVIRKISINEIVQVGKRQKLIFFDRFFYIRTREGRKFRFYTRQTKKAVNYLNSLIHKF